MTLIEEDPEIIEEDPEIIEEDPEVIEPEPQVIEPFVEQYPPYPLEYGDISQNYKNILFIDNAVDGLQTIINSVNSDTFYIIYSGCSSKVDVSNLLQILPMNTINRIGFFFTISADSKIFLDRRPFYDPSMNYIESDETPSDTNFEFMVSIINTYNITNIDYLACNTLTFQSWNNYYNGLMALTNVIVGASDNETGNIKYGGDWTLETTGQTIEFIYFNQSIEYYKYLLDSLTWVSGLPNAVNGIDVYNGNIYASVYGATGYIIKVNTSTAAVTLNWTTTLNNATSVTINNPYVYVSVESTSQISQINISTGSVITAAWIGGGGTWGIGPAYTFGGSYFYIIGSSFDPDRIQLINLSTTLVINNIWFSNINYPILSNMTHYNGFLYVGVYPSMILRFDPNNPTFPTFTLFSSGLNSVQALTAFGDYLYVANSGNGTISLILLSTGEILNANWATGLNTPKSITTDGTYLYIGNANGTISQITLSQPTINIQNNSTIIKYKSAGNFIDICNNFTSKIRHPINIFNGQNFSTGIFCYYNSIKYDLAELYLLNSTLNTNLLINSNIFTRYNGVSHDINKFFIPMTQQMVIITGGPTIRGFRNSRITSTNYNGADATSGTLYTFTSTTTSQSVTTLGTFRLTNGSMKCYILSIGPGGGAGSGIQTSGGGSGYFIAFPLGLNITYTITYVSSGPTVANTVAGYCNITSNASPQTINITTPGSRISNNAVAASQTGNITGGTVFTGGARATALGGNGGNGFTIPTNISTGSVSNSGVTDFINLITQQNNKNGFSAAGKAGSNVTQGGAEGGQYNIGGTAGAANRNGLPGLGYGTSGGAGRSLSAVGTGGIGGQGVVMVYFSPLI